MRNPVPPQEPGSQGPLSGEEDSRQAGNDFFYLLDPDSSIEIAR